MYVIRVASAVLLGAAVLVLGACTAHAAEDGDTSFGFSIEPDPVEAGDEVTLRVDNCRYAVRVSSAVFDPVGIPRGRATARATVDWDAKPGIVHQVIFECGRNVGIAELTVTRQGVSSAARTPVSPRPAQRPQPSRPPARYGAHAGEGGGAAGSSLRNLGVGAALVIGSFGAAYHCANRRTGEEEAG